MARISLTKPTTFLSALAIALVSTFFVVVIMEVWMIFQGEIGTIYVDVILILTLFVGVGMSTVVLWGFATKRLGYVWA